MKLQETLITKIIVDRTKLIISVPCEIIGNANYKNHSGPNQIISVPCEITGNVNYENQIGPNQIISVSCD